MTATQNEILEAANILKKMVPGTLPQPLFIEITRIAATPIVEIVPLRKNQQGEIEILLTKRDTNDPTWPGMYHTPGTVVRPSDTEGSYKDSFDRILAGELKNTPTTSPIFVTNYLHKVKRGMESSLIYWVEVTGKPLVGEFFNSNNLPVNLIDTQIDFINIAIGHYLQTVS